MTIYIKTGRRYLETELVGVSRRDMWTLLLQSVRYSMGRMSMAPSHSQDMVREHVAALNDHCLAQIQREVVEELERANESRKRALADGAEVSRTDCRYWLGHECDHRGWLAFANWCGAELQRRMAVKP